MSINLNTSRINIIHYLILFPFFNVFNLFIVQNFLLIFSSSQGNSLKLCITEFVLHILFSGDKNCKYFFKICHYVSFYLKG